MPQIGDIQLRECNEVNRKGGFKRNRFIYHACEDCGKERWVFLWAWKKGLFRFCQPCAVQRSDFNVKSIHWGADNWKWQGGIKKDKGGYISIRVYPDNPYFSMANRRYIPEHRLVMAQALGRVLSSKEFVHHKDGDPSNNVLSNLEICAAENHKLSYRLGYNQGFQDGLAYSTHSKQWELYPEKAHQAVKVVV